MSLRRKCATVGATAFSAIAIACFAWYKLIPGDQLILLSLLALPADVPFLLAISTRCPPAIQALGVAVSGALQFGFIGYFVGDYAAALRARKSAPRRRT
jgi:hypothetical protein